VKASFWKGKLIGWDEKKELQRELMI